MKNTDLIPAPELLGKINSSWTEKDFKFAIKKFRQNAPSAPIPRLYDAYRWLKEQIDKDDAESDKQFTRFIEHFLRILEERGAAQSEIYSEVLRDSAEYRYLKNLFHSDEPEHETVQAEITEKPVKKAPPALIKKLSLKEILLKKNIQLSAIDNKEWSKLVSEHFENFKAAESFEKNCTSLVKNISRRSDIEPYHTEIIVSYAYDRLLKYKTLTLKTKDFAMKLLNLMTNRGETWNRLHKEYLEIIRK